MTDRELLELAAKAAGIKIKTKFYEGDGWTAKWHHVISEDIDEWVDWNPLNDDGDALRLAVQLGIDLKFNGPTQSGEFLSVKLYVEKDTNDPMVVTRRQIVLAAAEIGKGMP